MYKRRENLQETNMTEIYRFVWVALPQLLGASDCPHRKEGFVQRSIPDSNWFTSEEECVQVARDFVKKYKMHDCCGLEFAIERKSVLDALHCLKMQLEKIQEIILQCPP